MLIQWIGYKRPSFSGEAFKIDCITENKNKFYHWMMEEWNSVNIAVSNLDLLERTGYVVFMQKNFMYILMKVKEEIVHDSEGVQ